MSNKTVYPEVISNNELLIYYKMNQTVITLRNAAAFFITKRGKCFITNLATFIIKSDRYYKMSRFTLHYKTRHNNSSFEYRLQCSQSDKPLLTDHNGALYPADT